MKKLTTVQSTLLRLIANAGGSFCPHDGMDPMAVRALGDLVKAKRLTVEETDAAPRYHLTAQGRADAS